MRKILRHHLGSHIFNILEKKYGRPQHIVAYTYVTEIGIFSNFRKITRGK